MFRLQGLVPDEQFAVYASGMVCPIRLCDHTVKSLMFWHDQYRCVSKMENFTFDFEFSPYFRASREIDLSTPEEIPSITDDLLYYGQDSSAVDVAWDEELSRSFATESTWRGIYEQSQETFSFGTMTFNNLLSATDAPTPTPLSGTGFDAKGSFAINGSVAGHRITFVRSYSRLRENDRAMRFEGNLDDVRKIISGFYGEAAQSTSDFNSSQITQGSAVGEFALALRPAWWFSSRASIKEIKGTEQGERTSSALWRIVREAILYPLFFRKAHLGQRYLEEARRRKSAFLDMHARYSGSLSRRIEEVDWLQPLDSEQKRHFAVLQNILQPRELVFLTALSDFLIRRQVIHRCVRFIAQSVVAS